MRIVAARRSRMATSSTWNCPLCIYFAAPTMKQIVRHIGAVHSEDETDRPECQADQPDILTTKQACLFLLKSKEIYKVSECNLNPLIGDISIIVDSTVRYLERKVGQALMEKGILLSDELSQVFHSPQLFHGLQSEYLRKKYN